MNPYAEEAIHKAAAEMQESGLLGIGVNAKGEKVWSLTEDGKIAAWIASATPDETNEIRLSEETIAFLWQHRQGNETISQTIGRLMDK
jgi:hypothetical protein